MQLTAMTHPKVVLERESQAFVEATSTPPFLYELTPAEARKVLDDVQAEPIDKLPVEDRWITVPAEVGDVRVRIVRPPDAEGTLPVILYIHGGGWVLGNADTHDRLVRGHHPRRDRPGDRVLSDARPLGRRHPAHPRPQEGGLQRVDRGGSDDPSTLRARSASSVMNASACSCVSAMYSAV